MRRSTERAIEDACRGLDSEREAVVRLVVAAMANSQGDNNLVAPFIERRENLINVADLCSSDPAIKEALETVFRAVHPAIHKKHPNPRSQATFMIFDSIKTLMRQKR